MTTFNLTFVIDVRAAGRDRCDREGTPGQSNILTALLRRNDDRVIKLFSDPAIMVVRGVCDFH